MKNLPVQLSQAEHQVAQDSVDILSTNSVAALMHGASGVYAFDSSGNGASNDSWVSSKINQTLLIGELGGAYEIAGFESELAYTHTERRTKVPKTITRSWREAIKAGTLQRETTVEEERVEYSSNRLPALMVDPRTGEDVPKARLSYDYNFYNARFNSEDSRVMGKRSPYYGMQSPRGFLMLQGFLPQDLADNLYDVTLEKPVALRAVVTSIGAVIMSRIAGDGRSACYRNAQLPEYSDLPDRGNDSGLPEWSLFVAQLRAVRKADGNYEQGYVSRPEQGTIVPVGSLRPEDMQPTLR
jgi:hypothetical protein